MTKEEKLKKIVRDETLWMKAFVKIVDKNGRLVPFVPTYHQMVLSRNFGKFNIVNKARQLGVTSFSLGKALYLTHTRPDVVCVLMGATDQGTDIVFKKLKQMYDNLDPCVKIPQKLNNRKELELENRSRIICCTCSSSDKLRGASIIYLHLTEVSSMDSEKLENQLTAAYAALLPEGQVVLESTSKGVGNLWYEMWTQAVNGESQYKPFFFSWVDDTRLFATAYELQSKAYINRFGKALTKEEFDDEEMSLYHRMNGDTNPLAMKKLMWRRMEILNHPKDGLQIFHQEYPSSASESFLVSSNNMFDLNMIQARLNHVHETPIIPMPANAPPLMQKWKKDITIWRLPRNKQEKFALGADTGEGIGADRSVCEIFDFVDGFQCLEFVSNRIKPYEYSDLIRQIATYYNKCLIVPEKASAGHTVVDKLLEPNNRYVNIYKSKVYDAKGKARKKPGFETTAKSRPIILNRLQEEFEKSEICINSKGLLNEMKVFQLDNNGKFQAEQGSHDDMVMATAMSLAGIADGKYYI